MVIEDFKSITRRMLLEAEGPWAKDKKSSTKTDVKDKTKPLDMEMPTNKGSLSTSNKKSSADLTKPTELGKTLSKDEVKKKLSNMRNPEGSAEAMRHAMDKIKDVTDTVPHDNDDVDTTVGVPEPKVVTPETLPAIISKGLTAKGDKEVKRKVDVNWMQLKQLPGYAIQQIRGAFRPLFDNIMNCNLEDINVVTNIGGLSSTGDIKQLAGYIAKYGIKDDSFSLEAFDIDPEIYHIEKAFVYNWEGVAYLLIEEHRGSAISWYVYAGPGRNTKINTAPASKQIH